MPDVNRHRPDDDLVETEFAAFDGFWQYQFLDAGPKPANGGPYQSAQPGISWCRSSGRSPRGGLQAEAISLRPGLAPPRHSRRPPKLPRISRGYARKNRYRGAGTGVLP